MITNVSNAAVGDIAVHHGVYGESRCTFDSEFRGYVLSVGEDCMDAYVQYVGDFLVYMPACDKPQHFDFALRQFAAVVARHVFFQF